MDRGLKLFEPRWGRSSLQAAAEKLQAVRIAGRRLAGWRAGRGAAGTSVLPQAGPSAIAAASFLFVGPVYAEPWSCQFTARCLAGLACEAQDWTAEVIAADHEGQLFLTAAALTSPVERLAVGAYAASGLLLSIDPTGTAVLSTHQDAVASHFGSCEVLE